MRPFPVPTPGLPPPPPPPAAYHSLAHVVAEGVPWRSASQAALIGPPSRPTSVHLMFTPPSSARPRGCKPPRAAPEDSMMPRLAGADALLCGDRPREYLGGASDGMSQGPRSGSIKLYGNTARREGWGRWPRGRGDRGAERVSNGVRRDGVGECDVAAAVVGEALG